MYTADELGIRNGLAAALAVAMSNGAMDAQMWEGLPGPVQAVLAEVGGWV